MKRALIVVDVQNDFCEGGSLAVTGGNLVASRIGNHMVGLGKGQYGLFDYMVATKDFHIPGDSNGGHIVEKPDYVNNWPSHCIQGTYGAQFHPAVAEVADMFDAIFYKGQGRPDYSGFQGKTMQSYLHRDGEYLLGWLTEREVTHVDVVGLAADFCVGATALDAVQAGFAVRIPVQMTAAVRGPEYVTQIIEKVKAAQGVDTGLIN